MESAAIGILALSGIAAVAAILALAFGRYVVVALDSAFSKWRRLGFLGRVITAAMVVVAGEISETIVILDISASNLSFAAVFILNFK